MNTTPTPPARRHLRSFTDVEQEVMARALIAARRECDSNERQVLDTILRDNWMVIDRTLDGSYEVVLDALQAGWYANPIEAAKRVVQRLAERGLILPERRHRLHKAQPDINTLCKVCRAEVHEVPGGHGPTWIHTATGAVAAPTPNDL